MSQQHDGADDGGGQEAWKTDDSRLSSLADTLAREDPDRHLIAMLSPPTVRPALMTLFAVNLEIAKIPERVSEPILGQMRLQWWREALSGDRAVPAGSLAGETLAVLRGDDTNIETMLRIIDARQRDFETDGPPATMSGLCAFADETGGALSEIACRVLSGCDRPTSAIVDAVRRVGGAFSLIGLARATPYHAARNRSYLPLDLMNDSTTPLEPGSRVICDTVKAMCRAALSEIAEARNICRAPPRRVMAVFAQANLAENYAKALAHAAYDPFDPGIGYRGFGSAVKLLVSRLTSRY